MFAYPLFDVRIERNVDANCLKWPDRGEAGGDSGLGCNRLYCDFRGFSWRTAMKTLVFENGLVARIESATDWESEAELIDEELYEDEEGLFGMDLGVASSVVALSAAGCIPFSSCNAGAFGGSHAEAYPLIAFYARRKHVNLLIDLAESAAAGLESDSHGFLVVYSNDVRVMRTFATILINARQSFQAVRGRPAKKTSHTREKDQQHTLIPRSASSHSESETPRR